MFPCVLFGEGLTGSFLCFSRWLIAFGAALDHHLAILHTSIVLFGQIASKSFDRMF